jgi:catechol 2,3-dioxygenase-like lactoylglutathione lyase family enzyme
MKRSALLFTILLCCAAAASSDVPKRPRISGIGSVHIYVIDIDKARDFYSKLIGIRWEHGVCFDESRPCFAVGWSGNQTIQLENLLDSRIKNLVAEVTFTTDNVEQMRKYLTSCGVRASKISTFPDPGNQRPYEAHFEVRDPEGNQISFIQRFAYTFEHPGSKRFRDWPNFSQELSTHLIHAGFIVHDRAAEDKFYKDILGFHVYWHGGMKDNQTDWVDMQVPDGTDWLEYMLNVSPNADKKELGVMNHIALGVPDIKAAREQLLKNGMKLTEEPQIGRDGKWQLNLYDPDDTRVELMEFTPTQKPCCSDYTGPHPKP